MEYLQRTTTLQVTHIPHSALCRVGRARLKKGAFFIRAKALAQEVLSMDYALFYVQKGVPQTPQRSFTSQSTPYSTE